jgi:hypothetical protein
MSWFPVSAAVDRGQKMGCPSIVPAPRTSRAPPLPYALPMVIMGSPKRQRPKSLPAFPLLGLRRYQVRRDREGPLRP